MSILINMEMPKSCEYCRFLSGFECRALLKDITEFPVADFCPLIPVPPHGRLGDLDDFAKRMKSLVEKAENDGFDLGAVWYSAFVRHIELTPTIIPAEEGEI